MACIGQARVMAEDEEPKGRIDPTAVAEQGARRRSVGHSFDPFGHFQIAQHGTEFPVFSDDVCTASAFVEVLATDFAWYSEPAQSARSSQVVDDHGCRRRPAP